MHSFIVFLVFRIEQGLSLLMVSGPKLNNIVGKHIGAIVNVTAIT